MERGQRLMREHQQKKKYDDNAHCYHHETTMYIDQAEIYNLLSVFIN
jgi:hypothetical protein